MSRKNQSKLHELVEVFGKLTPKAREIIQRAEEEAYRFNHSYVSSEHLMLALLREHDNEGCKVLLKLENVDLRKIEANIEASMEIGSPIVRSMNPLPYTPRAKSVLSKAMDCALNFGREDISAVHLLWALTQDNGEVEEALGSLGINTNELNQLVSPSNLEKKTMGIKVPESVAPAGIWIVPRGYMTVEQLLECSGYKIFEGRITDNTGSIHLGVLRSQDTINGAPQINYDVGNISQVEEALRLRELLIVNLIKYSEKPSRNEVVKKLENMVLRFTGKL